jgi:hypothetical protein
MTVRIADTLCKRHATQFEWYWDRSIDADGCPACEEKADALRDVDGQLILRPLPLLSDAQFRMETAVHEASHAVVAIVTGMPLLQVKLSDNLRSNESGIDMEPFDAPGINILATLWAGQVGAQRWLTEQDLDTDANMIDVSWMGHDDTLKIRQWAESWDVPVLTGRREAAQMLDHRWTEIEQVAVTLIERQVIPAAGVRALLPV